MGIQMNLEKKRIKLRIEGDIYREHAEVLQAIIGDRVRAGGRSIHLDMVSVYYIDCKSLEILAGLQKELVDKGISLIFEHARDWRERIIECSSCRTRTCWSASFYPNSGNEGIKSAIHL